MKRTVVLAPFQMAFTPRSDDVIHSIWEHITSIIILLKYNFFYNNPFFITTVAQNALRTGVLNVFSSQ